MKVLVIAAHPDDEVLGCGGTIERLKREGHDIDIVILGKGRGDALDNQFDKLPLLNWVVVVEGHIKACKPEIIFTHYEYDLNIDHRITYQAVITATRPQPDCCVKEIYSFEVLSSTEWAFPTSSIYSPDVFYKLSGNDLQAKQFAMINEYKDELRDNPHPRSTEGIFTLARYRGMQCGCDFAEAFKTIRRIL